MYSFANFKKTATDWDAMGFDDQWYLCVKFIELQMGDTDWNDPQEARSAIHDARIQFNTSDYDAVMKIFWEVLDEHYGIDLPAAVKQSKVANDVSTEDFLETPEFDEDDDEHPRLERVTKRTASAITLPMETGVTPRTSARAWSWDHRLNGFTASESSAFKCSSCDSDVPVPSYHRCACGTIWNSYQIATPEGRRFMCREVPRRNTMLAKRE